MAFLDQIWHQFSQEIAQWVRNQWRQTPNMNPSAWVLHLKRRQQLQEKKHKIVIGFETLNIRTHLIWILWKWKLSLQAKAQTFISSTFVTFLWLFFHVQFYCRWEPCRHAWWQDSLLKQKCEHNFYLYVLCLPTENTNLKI